MSAQATDTPDAWSAVARRSARPWWTLPHRWRNPIGLVGAVIVLLTVVVALAAPLIAPYDPDAQESERLLPPS